MIIFILLLLLFNQNFTMSKPLSQQYLFLLALLFLCNNDASNINFNTAAFFNDVSPVFNPHISRCSYSGTNVCSNKKASSNTDNKKSYINFENSSALNKNAKKHFIKPKLYKKNNNEHILNKPSSQLKTDIKDNFNTYDKDENLISSNYHTEKHKKNNYEKHNYSAINNNSKNEINLNKNKMDEDNTNKKEPIVNNSDTYKEKHFKDINKEQCISSDNKEDACTKKVNNDRKNINSHSTPIIKINNTPADIIRKKYFGRTISIILSNFGIITGTVIFINNNITGLKLENGSTIYINNNIITSYY